METPKTFKELFAKTGIEPTTDENGNIHYNFKATMKEEPKQEKTAVEWLAHQMEHPHIFNPLIEKALEMEKQQIIESGNSCAFKQHLHSDRINKMSIDELEQYNLEPSYTFGEEHYNETFKK
jgi:hypothetical protein